MTTLLSTMASRCARLTAMPLLWMCLTPMAVFTITPSAILSFRNTSLRPASVWIPLWSLSLVPSALPTRCISVSTINPKATVCRLRKTIRWCCSSAQPPSVRSSFTWSTKTMIWPTSLPRCRSTRCSRVIRFGLREAARLACSPLSPIR